MSVRTQPFYVKLANLCGRGLGALGASFPRLDAATLKQRAVARTALSDFGDPAFEQGLHKLLDSLHNEAELSQLGRVAAHFNLLDNLSIRLQLIEVRKRRPEITAQSIQQPLFIVGLPRTGTTILYELIAQDPNMRAPASWEVAQPCPPPQANAYDSDPRIRKAERLLGLMEKLSPGFRAIHALGATLPQECVYMLAPQFLSEQFAYMYNVPSYRRWALEQDMTEAYAWHANYLRHLQIDCARDHWVLKTPAHLGYLPALLQQYPDARVVWTHREPAQAIASFASLATHLRSGFSDAIDPARVGDQELAHFSAVTARAVADRAVLPAEQFFDVDFEAICRDPVQVVQRLYAYFGLALAPRAEANMRAYLDARPRYLYGEHRYQAQDYGLDSAAINQAFQGYRQAYGAYL